MIHSVDFNQMPNLYSFINMIGPHLMSTDRPLCRPYINFQTEPDRQRWDNTVGMILSFRLQVSGFEPPKHHLEIGNSRPFYTVLYHHCFLF